MSSKIELDVIPKFALRLNGRDGPALPKKTRALLAYLAIDQGRKFARSVLAELLWSERGREQVHHSMRQALAELRKSFPAQDVVLSRDGTLSLGPEVAVNQADLLRAFAEGTDVEASVLASYSAPLLDGFAPISADFDEWLALTRSRLEAFVLDNLARQVVLAEQAGAAADAVVAAERMFAIDPLREDSHRHLLAAYAAVGRRTDALRQYANIVELLRRELNVAPARETRELAQKIRLDVAGEEKRLAPRLEPAFTAAYGPTIAVLPFELLGETHVPSFRLEGLTADICHQLAGLREFSVIAHGSTQGLRAHELALGAIGRLLGARFVVLGSVQSNGTAIRVRVELADVESGLMIWSRTDDCGLPIRFEEQDRLVSRIVHALGPRLHEAELRRIRGKRPATLTTYDKILLAREHLRQTEPASLLKAKDLLYDVIVCEPDYAEAYALASNCHSLCINEGLSRDRQAELQQLEDMAKRALDLDRDNVRALTMYGHRRSLLHRDYVSARLMFDRALELNPSAAVTWVHRSITCAYCGEVDAAIQHATRALELSPRDRDMHIFLTAFCIAHYVAGLYVSAAEWGMKALSERSVLTAMYRYVAAALAASGEIATAREIARRGLLKMPNQRTADIVASSAFRDEADRVRFGQHLLLAGFPP